MHEPLSADHGQEVIVEPGQIGRSQIMAGLVAFSSHLELETFRRLQDCIVVRSDSGQATAGDVETRPLDDVLFGQLLATAFDVLQSGQFKTSDSMFLVLLALRPDDLRSAIGMVTSVWQTQGVHSAAQIYEKLTEFSVDPELAYFASDCMYQAGLGEQALMILQRGIHQMQDAPDSWTHSDRSFLDNMFRLRAELETGRGAAV